MLDKDVDRFIVHLICHTGALKNKQHFLTGKGDLNLFQVE